METNFVQTPKTTNITQILPESSVSSPKTSSSGSPTLSQVILSDKMEEKISNMQLQQEINNYKDDMKDLQTELVEEVKDLLPKS